MKGFYAATDTTAKTLNDALFSAIDKHAKFLEGKTTPLTISATMGARPSPPARRCSPVSSAPCHGEGTPTPWTDPRHLHLRPVRRRVPPCPWHAGGEGGTTLTAQLPAGQWIKSVGIGIDNYWKTYGEMPKQDVTAAEGTYLIPDHSYRSLYPYFEPGDGVDTTNIRVYKAGDPNGNKARSWKSKADAPDG